MSVEKMLVEFIILNVCSVKKIQPKIQLISFGVIISAKQLKDHDQRQPNSEISPVHT